MKLECYLLAGGRLEIHPASRRRGWMDDTPDAFAYRCLPLPMANSHGWEIRCPASLEARWNGGNEPQDVEIVCDDGSAGGASGRFGSGILTMDIPAIFRTPPGFNLWVTGPVNQFKDGIQPLSALVETDWMPYTFSMNWKFTRPHAPVRFEQGEPFCFFFPVPRGQLEQFDPEIRPLSSDAALEQQHACARHKRLFLSGLAQLKPEGVKDLNPRTLHQLNWQGWYMRGKVPDESAATPEHQTKLHLKAFVLAADDANNAPAAGESGETGASTPAPGPEARAEAGP
jgi:hypothetical protein